MQPDVHGGRVIHIAVVVQIVCKLFTRRETALHPDQFHEVNDRMLQSSFSEFLAASLSSTAATSTDEADAAAAAGIAGAADAEGWPDADGEGAGEAGVAGTLAGVGDGPDPTPLVAGAEALVE